MRPRPVVAAGVAVAALAGVIAVVVVTTRSPPEDPHITRGKEFLSVQSLPAAITELKLALKSDPDSTEAKGLLLYATLHADPDGPASAADLFEILPTLSALADGSQRDSLPPDLRKGLSDLAKKVRASLYEEGIDTRDVAELAAVVKRAAVYALRDAAGAPDADQAAFALASAGDRDALAHLCERLKSDSAEDAPGLLERLGDRAVPALRKVIADRQNLGRARAVQVLTRLLARQRARELFTSEPHLRGIEQADLPAALRDAPGAGDIESRYAAGLTRQLVSHAALIDLTVAAADQLASFYAPLGEDRGVLVLEGKGADRDQVLVRAYVFDRTDYRPAEIREGGRATFVTAPVVGLRAAGPDRVEMTFLSVARVPTERKVKKASFHTGDRVVLKSRQVRGTVEGTDDYGLIEVGLDRATEGMTRVEVAPGKLLGLETVTVEQPGRQVRTATVKGTRIDLGPARPAVAGSDDLDQVAGSEVGGSR